MKKVYFMLADGFEETEFTAPWDLLLRAGAEVTVFSVSGNEYVTGAHGLTVKADKSISVPDADCDLIVLPGGGKGTQNLAASEKVASAVRAVYANGGFVAAICAAPPAAPSGAAAALSGIPDAMRIRYRSAVSGRDGCSACRSFSYSRGRNSVMTPRYRLGRNVF